MRRFGFVTLFLLAAFALAATMFQPKASLAETPQPVQRTLDVSGTGKLTVKYDTAEVTLGVSELKPAAGEAYSAMSNSMDKIVNVLKKAGIKEEDIKTGTFNLNAEYDWKDGTQNLRGFRSTNTLIITTNKLDQVATLIQAAVEAGSNQLQGVRFYVKDTDALLNQALDLAVDDAKAKADRVAKRLGTEVVGVYRISVADGGRTPVMFERGMEGAKYMADVAGAPAAQVFSGTGEYTATVSVTFEIK